MIEEKLFLKGIASFNKKQFYDAHEHWEGIWSEITVPDDLFFQGLIQMSVAYFHITNHNLKGAKSLFTKSINKLEQYTPFHRGLDIQLILLKIKKSLDILNKNSSTDNFIWDIVPILKIND